MIRIAKVKSLSHRETLVRVTAEGKLSNKDAERCGQKKVAEFVGVSASHGRRRRSCSALGRASSSASRDAMDTQPFTDRADGEMPTALFPLGHLVATPGALDAILLAERTCYRFRGIRFDA